MEQIIYCIPRQAILKFANRFPNTSQVAYSSENTVEFAYIDFGYIDSLSISTLFC